MSQQNEIDRRWQAGIPHRQESLEFRLFLAHSGLDDVMDLKFGGDGDNGEDILFAIDAWLDARPTIDIDRLKADIKAKLKMMDEILDSEDR